MQRWWSGDCLPHAPADDDAAEDTAARCNAAAAFVCRLGKHSSLDVGLCSTADARTRRCAHSVKAKQKQPNRRNT